MDSPQLERVVSGLLDATNQAAFKWERTDDPAVFMLSRPQGIVLVSKFLNPNRNVRAKLRMTDPDGTTVLTWTEAEEEHPMDRLMYQLIDAAEASASNLNETLTEWITDISNNTEPF